ncbi:MAG: NAD-dependent deacylase [Pyrinomonadaceae bacterium]|nr:NAD-dependent deacylase [Pyrinomonadaceae bacterium]
MRIPESVDISKVCVLSGAGISAESGVPTFRGGGESAVWKGMPFDVISSAEMVRDDLNEVWEWFDHRRKLLSACEPNAAHYALANIEECVESFLIATQNVDGLHDRAGSKNIVELHGNINRARCTVCGNLFDLDYKKSPHEPSECTCKGQLRPDVVLFGEMLPSGAFETAREAAADSGIFILVGTSAVVYPAASIPLAAKSAGAFLIEVNPEETPLSAICDESVRNVAGEVLPLLTKQIWGIE